MGTLALACVFVGAGVGACLRWVFNLWLNPILPALPLGTLAANLLGGYLVGAAIAFFSVKTSLPAEARLLVFTGFLGGLTTFSTFSAEVVEALLGGRAGWALATVTSHLVGSLGLTALGLWSVGRWLAVE
jgi:CrcB protein